MTDEFDEVLTQLEPLRFTPTRSAAASQAGRQSFLDEAARLRPAVSAQPVQRLTGWRSKFTQERSTMFALAIKVVLMLAVMLGGAGVTATAAQSSLPNDALYPVKLLIEEAQSSLASDPDAQIDAQLDHAQQRVHEMAQLADRGAVIPADVPARLQTQLQAALQIAAQLDDQHLPAALDRIQLRTQDQLREMDRLHLNETIQVLTQVRVMAQLGQHDPQLFRDRVGQGRPDAAPLQPAVTPQVSSPQTPQGPRASVTPQPSRTPQATCTPQRTPQPLATGIPQQGQGYGPGPQSTSQPVATPVGQGEGHEYGPGPQATDIPGGGPQSQNTPQGSGEPQPQNTSQSGGTSTGPGSGSGSGGRP